VPPTSTPATLTLPYRHAGVEGTVNAEVGVNDDPAALGCADFARGFPYFRATLTPPARGYADALGWVQLVRWPQVLEDDDFRIDPFAPLGEVSHPFGFYGFSPTMFDAPHTEVAGDWEFIAHCFLCGLGGELLEMRHEAVAVLGIRWGFRRRGGRFENFGPDVLAPADWDRHHDHLASAFPRWTFHPGFAADG
jgi:hypothetical protein